MIFPSPRSAARLVSGAGLERRQDGDDEAGEEHDSQRREDHRSPSEDGSRDDVEEDPDDGHADEGTLHVDGVVLLLQPADPDDDTVLLVVEGVLRLQRRVSDPAGPRVLRGDGLTAVVTVGAEAPGGDVLVDVVDLPVNLSIEPSELFDGPQGGLVGVLDEDRVDAPGITAGLIDTVVEGLGGLPDGPLGGLSRPHHIITAGLVGQLDDLIQTLEGLDDVFAAVDRLCGDLGQRLLIVHGRSFFRAAIQPLLLVGLLPPAGWQQ